ncbi:hypothetical protein LC724_19750 [Blautia sp. RD014234]|nr:hypothetical protein [Blautia parvula]
MRVKLLKGILTVLSLICILCIPVTPIYAESQGTDGTEMQVMEPEKLEIQLGADWAGVEFQMKTDSGMYPGTIAVGDDGVLRMELGGSKSYVLTCMNSSVSAPEATQAPATTEEAQKRAMRTRTAMAQIASSMKKAQLPVSRSFIWFYLQAAWFWPSAVWSQCGW